MSKRLISFILLAIILLGDAIMLCSCEKESVSVSLEFLSDPINGGDSALHACTVDWNDEDFNGLSSTMSPKIAKTAMILSAAAFSSSTALDDLKTLGFEKNAKFNYGDNDKSAVGVIISSKKVADYTLVAMVLRGTSGEEWYSNFDVGTMAVHDGFNAAAGFAYKKLEMYLVNYGIDRDHMRLFVTGHSRGGAVANLVSAQLVDDYGAQNVFCYTFAAPNVTTEKRASDSKYKGIINFVNREDFIAQVPLEKWGYTKYGTIIDFPTSSTDEQYSEKLSAVKTSFEKLTGRNFDSFGSTKAVDKFLKNAYKLAPTVEDYYNKKYSVDNFEMSLYGYMMTLAELLNDKNTLENGLVMVSTQDSELAPLTEFLLSGIDVENLMLTQSYDGSLIAYSHTGETYLAWLDSYQ